jgi:hypothetical protein
VEKQHASQPTTKAKTLGRKNGDQTLTEATFSRFAGSSAIGIGIGRRIISELPTSM